MPTETIVEPMFRVVKSLADYLRQLQDFSLYLDKVGEGTGELYTLFFRGQSKEYLDAHRKPFLYPKLFRTAPVSACLTKGNDIEWIRSEIAQVFKSTHNIKKAQSRVADLFERRKKFIEATNDYIRECQATYADREDAILSAIINEYPERFASFPLWLDRLAIAQHFGMATRLLDITRNALVALYFAVADENSHEDGVVYVFLADKQSFDLSLRNNDIAEAFANPDTWRGENVKASFDASLNLRNKDIKPVIVSSRFVSERQRRQSGHFILFPNKVVRWMNKRIMQPYTDEVRSIMIPKGKKSEIKLDLERLCGIDEHFLFPEDMERYSRQLLVKASDDVLNSCEFGVTMMRRG